MKTKSTHKEICGQEERFRFDHDCSLKPTPTLLKSPLPWVNDGGFIVDVSGRKLFSPQEWLSDRMVKSNADYAVMAVNTHQELVTELKKVSAWLSYEKGADAKILYQNVNEVIAKAEAQS